MERFFASKNARATVSFRASSGGTTAIATSWLTLCATRAPAGAPTFFTMLNARIRGSRSRSSIRTFHAVTTFSISPSGNSSSAASPGSSITISCAPTPSIRS